MTDRLATSPFPTLRRDDLPLPLRPHRPGSGSSAEMVVLNKVKALCPAVTDPMGWRDNLPYRYGWSLFEAGFYWEAHEVWEPVWLASRPNSPERIFLKAAIQMANGSLKLALGKTNAARRLFDEVDSLRAELQSALGAETGSYMGVDLAVFDRTGEITRISVL